MEQNKKQIKKATAIKYDPSMGDQAPKVIATGKGKLAEKIIDKAGENNIPIHTDPDLVNLLNMIEIGEEIPPELYNVIAQVLVFIGKMDKLKGS